MRDNRSIPSATVVPVLIYPDVREAVAWLSAAFGFVERVQIGENHRSQMSVGDGGAVIIGDVRRDRVPPRPGETTHSVRVRVEDVNGHLARAREHGAEIRMEPVDFEYGERSTRPPTRGGTSGHSPRRSTTSTPRHGAARCSCRDAPRSGRVLRVNVSSRFDVGGFGVVVTGGASGLGLAYGEVLAAHGARVTLIDVDAGGGRGAGGAAPGRGPRRARRGRRRDRSRGARSRDRRGGGRVRPARRRVRERRHRLRPRVRRRAGQAASGRAWRRVRSSATPTSAGTG